MKKIITMMLCGVAMVGLADLSALQCNACGTTTETSCQVWFKGSGSGKISTVSKSQLYKTVKTLKISSCQLVIGGGDSNATVQVVVRGTKKGVGSFEKTLECSEFVWNVFGKKLNDVTTGKTKKGVSLDSEMWFVAATDDGAIEISGALTGKVKGNASGSACSPCGDAVSVKWTPGTFKGRFHGRAVVESCECASELTFELGEGSCSDNSCIAFVEPTDDMVEVLDGTITLKYDSKQSGFKARVVAE